MPTPVKRVKKATRKYWTDEEVAKLTELVLAGASKASVGRELGRSTGSVISKTRDLGLPCPPGSAPEEVAVKRGP